MDHVHQVLLDAHRLSDSNQSDYTLALLLKDKYFEVVEACAMAMEQLADLQEELQAERDRPAFLDVHLRTKALARLNMPEGSPRAGISDAELIMELLDSHERHADRVPMLERQYEILEEAHQEAEKQCSELVDRCDALAKRLPTASDPKMAWTLEAIHKLAELAIQEKT